MDHSGAASAQNVFDQGSDNSNSSNAEFDTARRHMANRPRVGVQKISSDPLNDAQDTIEEIEAEENEVYDPFENDDDYEVNAFDQGVMYVQPDGTESESESTTDDIDAEALPGDPTTAIPTTASALPSEVDAGALLALPDDPTTATPTIFFPSLPPQNTIPSAGITITERPGDSASSPLVGFVLGFFCFGLLLAVGIVIQEVRKRRRIRSYIGGFAPEDFEMRRTIIGGWHGHYKTKLKLGIRDNDNDNDNDSDTRSNSNSDDDDRSQASDSRRGQSTILFSDLGLETGSHEEDALERLEWGQDHYTMQLADNNIYLDDDSSYSSGGGYDTDDFLSSVRYGASETFEDEDEDIQSLNGD